MKAQVIKFKNLKKSYSIFIGNKILGLLQKKIKVLCPKTKKIAVIIDENIPKKFEKILRRELKNYNSVFIKIKVNERAKSLKTINFILDELLKKNFNRSDLIIGVGGGIIGDTVGFAASIFKRGVNFINLPTTFLAQVDSAIGGKTGVNSVYGKNLIGSFYQPKLVIIDTSFLDSLPKREMICGYAEVLKHSIIKDKKFFNWLKKNTKNIFLKNSKVLISAIKKSCEIKLFFVNKDVNEKGIRMILNFGHTFAHAIEVKNNYSTKFTHGEAVLSGMILATKLSIVKKVCNSKILKEIVDVYKLNNLTYTINKYSKLATINELVKYLKNDKKNDDDKINFILLRSIGKTTQPNKFKISVKELKHHCKSIAQF